MSQFEEFKSQILISYQPTGRVEDALMLADYFEENGSPRLAASAIDYAFGLDPKFSGLEQRRQILLSSLSVNEHGICFRYIPAGTFLMGSNRGDPDEGPIHPVRLDDYWVSEIPITWSAYTDLMGWEPPPAAHPKINEDEPPARGFGLMGVNKIRLQYCESGTKRALDWHAHQPETVWSSGETSAEMFGEVPREHPERPWQYDKKPLVAVAHQDARAMAAKISNDTIQYRLPLEAEWEKAARGGLINQLYPWGNRPPTHANCDFDHFGEFFVADPRKFSPNGYGLLGMSGGVWEWTDDPYDGLAYQAIPETELSNGVRRIRNRGYRDDQRIAGNDTQQFVMRGGSWSDCAKACTVSFRQGLASVGWDAERDYASDSWTPWTPNTGFRLCRVELNPE